jgi:TolB-like protein
MFDVFDANDQQSRDSAGVKALFRRPGRYSGVRNRLADSDVIEKGFFASEPESNETISENAIRDELSRILESSIFVQSDRLGRFLRFTVEKTFAGEGETLKEYLIGTEVYDRPSSYRPSEDSIVRGEARRLRSKLKEYYESVGKNNPLSIHYRPGSYVPMFRNQHRRVNFSATEAAPRDFFTGGDGIRIAVLPFLDASGNASSGVCAQLITDDLIHELVRTDGIRVTAASSVAPLIAKAMDIRSLARKLDVQIVFEGTVRHDNNLLRITSWVVDPADGFQIWSERIETEPDLKDLSTVSERIASSLVSRLRSTNGWLGKPRIGAGSLEQGINSNRLFPCGNELDQTSSGRKRYNRTPSERRFRTQWGMETPVLPQRTTAQSASCSADSQPAGRIRPF